jgi:Na+-transporting NADH:ubiquinone oxidoreductase subunit NqrC
MFIIFRSDEVCDVLISQVILSLANMDNKTNFLSKKSAVFQVAIVLSATMLATLAIPSLAQTKAFAQGPIATDVNNHVDVAVKTHIINDQADCIKASDQTDQYAGQSVDERTSSPNENMPQVLTGVNTATNVAVTPDVDLTGQCDSADQTNQGIEQDQSLQPDGTTDAYTTSINQARNIAIDPNFSLNQPEQ